MRPAPPRLAVVIVNWNSGRMLEACLAALDSQRLPATRTIVVDNHSSDGSEQAAEGRASRVELVRSGRNLGFAAGNNLGFQRAEGCDWLATLNPDAFPEPEWLDRLLGFAEEHPDGASFASRMLMANDPERLDGAGDFYHVSGWAGRRGHGNLASSETRAADEVFSACAAAALYRRSALEAVGGFDESYFCYFEDVDLGFRLRLAGHRCYYVPDAVVRHVGSASTGRHSAFAVYHGHRNLVWTYFKNVPTRLLWTYLPQHLAFNAVALARFSAVGLAGPILRAKLDALRGLARVLRARSSVQGRRTASETALRSAMTGGVLFPYRIGPAHASGTRGRTQKD